MAGRGLAYAANKLLSGVGERNEDNIWGGDVVSAGNYSTTSDGQKTPTIRTVVISNKYNRVPALQAALKAKILSSGHYRLSESLDDMDLNLDMDCLELSPKTIACAYAVDFYGKSVEPIVIGPSSPHLASGSDADRVAEAIYKTFLEVTDNDSILYHEDMTRQRIAMYCADTAHKEWCQPPTVKPKPSS